MDVGTVVVDAGTVVDEGGAAVVGADERTVVGGAASVWRAAVTGDDRGRLLAPPALAPLNPTSAPAPNANTPIAPADRLWRIFLLGWFPL